MSKPEGRDLSEIIKVLKANIKAPTWEGAFHPNTCLTKGEMTFLVEILEQVMGQSAKGEEVQG